MAPEMVDNHEQSCNDPNNMFQYSETDSSINITLQKPLNSLTSILKSSFESNESEKDCTAANSVISTVKLLEEAAYSWSKNLPFEIYVDRAKASLDLIQHLPDSTATSELRGLLAKVELICAFKPEN